MEFRAFFLRKLRFSSVAEKLRGARFGGFFAARSGHAHLPSPELCDSELQ